MPLSYSVALERLGNTPPGAGPIVPALRSEAVADLHARVVVLHWLIFQGSFVHALDSCALLAFRQPESRPTPTRRPHMVVRLCIHGSGGHQAEEVRHFPRG